MRNEEWWTLKKDEVKLTRLEEVGEAGWTFLLAFLVAASRPSSAFFKASTAFQFLTLNSYNAIKRRNTLVFATFGQTDINTKVKITGASFYPRCMRSVQRGKASMLVYESMSSRVSHTWGDH